jgi:Fe2+ transport system protein FeoA
MTPTGAKVKIARIVAGRSLHTRLATMGIYEGTTVEVISNVRRGPVIISRGEARYGLGFGMAKRILVTYLSSPRQKRE